MLVAKRTERAPKAAPGNANNFESLGSVFLARLQSERMHLVALSAALAGAEENSAPIFQDLQFRAKRLSEAAGVLEAHGVARLASGLERAASLAVQYRAQHTDSGVWGALIELMEMLGTIEQQQENRG